MGFAPMVAISSHTPPDGDSEMADFFAQRSPRYLGNPRKKGDLVPVVDLVQIPTGAYNPRPGTIVWVAENGRFGREPSPLKIRISSASAPCGPTRSALGRRAALVHNGSIREGDPGCQGRLQSTSVVQLHQGRVARILPPTAKHVTRLGNTPSQALQVVEKRVSILAGRFGFASIRLDGRTDDTSAGVIRRLVGSSRPNHAAPVQCEVGLPGPKPAWY